MKLKANAKENETPERRGNPVVLSDWRKDYLTVKEGETQSEVQKYLSENAGEELKDSEGRVTAIKTEHIMVTIEVAKIRIEDKPYDMEYAALTAVTAYGRLLLCNGVDDLTFEGEGDDRKEVPSVTKYFNTAFSQNARNAAAARIRTDVEGPAKALASAAKKLAGVWGVTEAEAAKRIAAMAA